MDLTAIRKRLFGEEAKDAVCSIIGAVLGMGSVWAAGAIAQWVVAPFLVRFDASALTLKDWDALYFRAEVLGFLVLIGFAGSLSRLHPLIGRVLWWTSYITGINLLFRIIVP